MKPRALCLVRHEPHYRRDACHAGLRAAGFEVIQAEPYAAPPPFTPQRDDVLLIWNRYGTSAQFAQDFEKIGAAVIVIENGYLGASYEAHGKPFDREGAQIYAMALEHHNGAGRWHVGEPGRWRIQQGIQVQPWRRDGTHVLILPQRGIGPPGVAMPHGWPEKAQRALQGVTGRPVVVRAHPGNYPALKPLAADLRDAWCAVTWGSGAALKALCAGVPVFHAFQKWIGAPAARFGFEHIERPVCGDQTREAMLDRLAWAQWTVPEIAGGEPFRQLLAVHKAVLAKVA